MVVVGVRELKSKLSAYLRRVKAGDVVLVTDRGAVVAEIRTPGAAASPTPYPRLNQLIRDGIVRLGRTSPDVGTYHIESRPQLPSGRALSLLDELRGDR